MSSVATTCPASSRRTGGRRTRPKAKAAKRLGGLWASSEKLGFKERRFPFLPDIPENRDIPMLPENREHPSKLQSTDLPRLAGGNRPEYSSLYPDQSRANHPATHPPSCMRG